jgi:hypothetical protein
MVKKRSFVGNEADKDLLESHISPITCLETTPIRYLSLLTMVDNDLWVRVDFPLLQAGA